MTMFNPGRRLAALGAALVLSAAAAACNNDINGPAKVLGDPILNLSLGPAGNAVMPGGSYTLSANKDTLTITLTNLPPLPANSRYQVLLVDSQTVDSTTNNVRPVSGRLITQTRAKQPVTRDSAIFTTRTDTTLAASSITVGDTNRTFTLRVVNADLGGDAIANYSHILVTVTSALVIAPGRLERVTRKGFLVARFRDAKGTPSRTDDTFALSGSFTFGSWTINASTRQPFSGPGSARGGFRGTNIYVTFNSLIRPPEGFQYAAWLIDDRTGRQVRLGTLVTPFPDLQSLANFDVDSGSFRTSGAIVQSQLRANADSLGVVFDDFTRFALLLEPKGSSTPPSSASAIFVVTAAIPQSVSSRHSAPGQVSGTVTSGSGASVTGTTLILANPTTAQALLVANADATGKFLFRVVNVGAYKLYAVPPGSATPSDSASITVGKIRAADGSSVGDTVRVTLRIP